ncbi:MAG TPA: RluA family pseudouridine synthase [Candidatus Omnitrophota bacterium]|nr:RluA family pseudouridine synthase [Candidatus Omnitrophota bacterium]HPS37468.1 RluA family pseudouridine synthase [Candidatus Omnitrophota bacterium]
MPKNRFSEFIVEADEAEQRLDVFLAQKMSDQHSRAQLQKLIKNGGVLVDGKVVTPHYAVKPGEKIHVEKLDTPHEELPAEPIALDIVYEDDDCLVVNKPAGMVVHPAPGNPHHTLVNALLFHVQNLGNSEDKIRPGIVHRLDKDTSGLLVVAKNDYTHAKLAKQFKDHSIDRVYHAIVRGVVQHDEGVCEEPVGRAFLNRKKVVVRPSGGKEATTCFKVLKRFPNATLVEIRPKTGRTHQIRVHFAHMGHAVLGDSFYGTPFPPIRRQALHASALGFEQPRTKKWIRLTSEMPEDMQNLLRFLEAQP